MTDQFPEKFGKYKIVEEVGRGGFADVYKAIDTTLDRTVALKFLEPRLLREPTFAERFQREAKLAANLKHPNIVMIHEFGWEAGTVYMAMEFLEGWPLKEVILEEGALPPMRIVSMVGQIASALDYAHGRGLVHRDIKPSNIMVGADDHVTVMDFGIARAATLTALTTTGRIFGTPEYMSPEQAEGLKEPDARSDIYSLGVVVYEMITGEVPFSGTTPLSVMRGHADKPPPRPAEINPDVSPAVEAVLLKALAKKREERYQTAGEMAVVLQQAVSRAVVEEVEAPAAVEAPPPIPPEVKKPIVEEVVSPLVQPAAVAKEEPEPPTAPPEPERPVPAPVPPPAAVTLPPRPKRAVFAPLTVTAIGWAVGWAVFGAIRPVMDSWVAELGIVEPTTISWTILGSIAGAIGGFLTGLALRWTEPSIQWKQVLKIALGWTLGWAIGVASAPVTGMPIAHILFWGIVGAVVGAVGGSITGRALRQAEPSVRTSTVALGWTIGWVIGEVIVEWLVHLCAFAWNWAIFGFVLGAIGGASGGGIMFWHLRRAYRRA